MPELPEVETTRRAIRPVLIGKRFTDVEILRPNMVKDASLLRRELTGSSVTEVDRVGKYLLVRLAHGWTMTLHLKMSGRLGLRRGAEVALTYERLRFRLDDGSLLIFNDPRTLGRVSMHPTAHVMREASLASMGPDALTVTQAAFEDRLARRRGPIKRILLDQSCVAGIGNIYADEACFLAGIDPNRDAASLTPAEKRALRDAVVATLEKGIANMGTTFSDFADLFGKPGQNQNSLAVYGRKGLPCIACAAPLRHGTISQRTTVWCGACQR
jgi:formamidopyrimidine-DNA glycosylase